MQDEHGVDFLGMRLAIVLAAAALLIAIAGIYAERQAHEASKDEARLEAGRIAAMASAEYSSGCPGSVSALSVHIPSSVRRVSYGLEDAGAYTIEFADGTNETYTAACRFLPAVLYPGRHTLELELLKNGEYAIGVTEAC
jgi:hypothetical protein